LRQLLLSGITFAGFPLFFFQAEDGIRDFHVTGVQTCALPILVFGGFSPDSLADRINDCGSKLVITADGGLRGGRNIPLKQNTDRSEERRVGKECRSRW